MARHLSVLRVLRSGVTAGLAVLAGRLAGRRPEATGTDAILAIDDPDRPTTDPADMPGMARSLSNGEAVRPHGDIGTEPASPVVLADPRSAAPESDWDDPDDPYGPPRYIPGRYIPGRYVSDPPAHGPDADGPDDATADDASPFAGDQPSVRRWDRRRRRLRPVLLGGGVAAVAVATLVALVAALPGTTSDPSQAIRDRTLVADLHTTALRMHDQVRALKGTGAVDAGLRYRRLAADAVDQRDLLRPRLSGIAAREALTTLDEAMESQRVAFGVLERTIAEIGIKSTEGWHGTVVAAANVLEQSIASIDRDDLMVWFLLMRLHEREFLLTGNSDLVGRVNEAGLNINFEIVRAGLPDARRTAVLQRLTDYTNAIASLSDLVQSRAAAETQVVLHGNRVARPLEVLAAQTNRAMRLAARDAAVTARRSESLAWISALIGAVGCLLLALGIALDAPMRAPPRSRYALADAADPGLDSDDDPGLPMAGRKLMPVEPDADPLLLTTPADPPAAASVVVAAPTTNDAAPTARARSDTVLPADRAPTSPAPASPAPLAPPSPADPESSRAEPAISSVPVDAPPATAPAAAAPTGGAVATRAQTRRLSVRLPTQTIRVVPEAPRAHPTDRSRPPDQR